MISKVLGLPAEGFQNFIPEQQEKPSEVPFFSKVNSSLCHLLNSTSVFQGSLIQKLAQPFERKRLIVNHHKISLNLSFMNLEPIRFKEYSVLIVDLTVRLCQCQNAYPRKNC